MKICSFRHLAAASLLMAGVALGRAYTVEGCVMEGKEGLNEVGVNILNTQGILLASTFTDSDGKFIIPDLEDDRIVIDVTDERYAPQRFEVATGKADTDLGVIALEKATNLNELTVIGSSTITTPGKTVVYANQTDKERASGSFNMLTLLSYKAPQIQINESEELITINGESPEIMVNGVKRPVSYIASIDQELIEKIEFTTMPDVRFGKTYINIITSRTPQGGRFKVDLRGAVTTQRYYYKALGEYTRGKNSFMLFYYGGYRNGHKEYIDETEKYFAPDKTTTLGVEGKPSSTIDRYNPLSFYFTRIPSDKSMLEISATLYPHNQDRVVRGFVTEPNESYDRTENRGWSHLDPSLDIYYQIRVSKTATLEFNATGSYSKGDSHRDLIYSTGYNSRFSSESDTWVAAGEAMWQQQLPFAWLNTGVSFKYNDSRNRYLINDEKTSQTLTSTSLNAYTSLGGTLFTVSYDLSAGVRYYKVLKGMVAPNVSAALQKNFGNFLSLTYRFNYNPGMPPLSTYNDIPTPVNDLLYKIGNDRLKAQDQIYNQFQITFTRNKLYASLSGTANITTDPMVTLYSYDSDPTSRLYGYFLEKTSNLNKFTEYQASCYVGLSNLWNFLSFQTQAGWHHSSYQGQSVDMTVCSWFLNLSLGLYWKGWQLNFVANDLVPSRMIWGSLTTIRRWPYTSLSLYKKFGNWNFSVEWANLFSKYGGRFRSETIAGAVQRTTDYRMNDQGNCVTLGVCYEFSTGKRLQGKNRSLHLSSQGDTGVIWDR